MRRSLLPITLTILLATCSSALADVPPGFLLKWGTSGSGPGQLFRPIGIEHDGGGNVYVADYRNDRVQKFSESGSFIAEWGPVSEPADVLSANGVIYVSSIASNRIYVYSTTGTLMNQWGGLGSDPGEMNGPWGLAADNNGNVYVADANNNRVQKFSSTGQYLDSWGQFGSGTGDFDGLRGICIDAAGFLYTTEAGNDRVQKFTLTGTFVTTWGACCAGEGNFNGPADIESDSNGDVYVADSGHALIQKFSAGGTYLTSWGYHGTGDGQFEGPAGISTDAQDRIYVCEFANDRVQVFDPTIAPPPPPAPGCNNQPKIMVHVTTPTTKNICGLGTPASLDQAVVKGSTATASGPFYFVYLIATRGSWPSIAGLQCGITYENNSSSATLNGSGVDVFNWNLCADLQFPEATWPAPGSGNTITWDKISNCQTGEIAVAGYFYVGAYSADTFRVIPKPADLLAAVADCGTPVHQTPVQPGDLGFVAFSPGAVSPGCNPCLLDCSASLPVPVENTTWGRIKSSFGR